MRSITLWQNVPSIHQAPMVRELADLVKPASVTVVTDEPLSGPRADQGWSLPEFGLAKLMVKPGIGERRAVLRETATEADVHIFSGFSAYPGVHAALEHVRRTAARILVFAEPGRLDDGLRAPLRKARYWLQAARYGSRVDAILATGETGYSYYRAVGFPQQRIRKFAYFTEPPPIAETGHRSPPNDVYSIAFVGAHIRRKRLDLVLAALENQMGSAWRLTIAGAGPLTGELQAITSRWESERVTWLGTLKNTEIHRLLRTQDLLVLPSAFDGWGAVVNEAIAVGTPVVASDACGASDLLVNPRIGDVFRSGDVTSLAETLKRRFARGPVTADDRRARAEWAARAISPAAGAKYLLSLITGHESGLPPWDKVEAEW